MLPTEAAALVAIRSVYEELIVYTGAGLQGATIAAVPTDGEIAGQFTARKKMFAIARAALPGTPVKGDQMTHVGILYRVIQTTFADEVDEWQVFVEKL